MPQAVTHLGEFTDGLVELLGFGCEHLPFDAWSAVWREHLRDLFEGEACGTPQSDQRQPPQHTGIKHAVQTPSADRGDQASLLVEAQRRGRKAGTSRHFRNIHGLSPLTSSRLEVAEYAFEMSGCKRIEVTMDPIHETDNTQAMKVGPNPGLLRPPLIFLVSILLGIVLNRAWPLHFTPRKVGMLGPLLTACAVVLFLLSYREFRRAGTSVRGSTRSNTIVRTGPYRFSRNPIYLAFILLVLGLSVWLNNLWLLVMLVPAVGVMAMVVIPREERFLERNFPNQYLSYKARVRRWL